MQLWNVCQDFFCSTRSKWLLIQVTNVIRCVTLLFCSVLLGQANSKVIKSKKMQFIPHCRVLGLH